MRGRNCYVVSYDIMDPKRLQKVHKTMKGFVDAVHYSVFRCDLTPKGRAELLVALHQLIQHDEEDFLLRRDLVGLSFDILMETGGDLSVKVLSDRDFQARKSYSFLRNVLAEGAKLA